MFQINHRYRLIRPAAYTSRVSPKTNYNYQAAMFDDVCGRWADGCKPPFRAISEDYFARELPHGLASEAVAFGLLALTTILPLINATSAVVGILSTKAF
jgi:hypothetical protein